MIKNQLGKTELSVSKLCFGTLTLSPLQAHLSNKKSAYLMKYAYESGVNFFDTADLYNNYEQLAHGLKEIGKHNVIVASKSYAYDEQTAKNTVEKSLKRLKREYIDIWLMHEQESQHTMRGHFEALKTYVRLKEQGYIRAIGVSTHFVEGVKAAMSYPDIDIIHPIYNLEGIGIQGGTKEDMLNAIREAHQSGIGIYGMKVFGGGHLLKDRIKAFQHMLQINAFDSLAIGMQTEAEIEYNVRFINDGYIDKKIEATTSIIDKKLMIHDWCTRCKSCIKVCQHNALHHDKKKDKIIIDHMRCVKCGYCSRACPEFCIKVI